MQALEDQFHAFCTRERASKRAASSSGLSTLHNGSPDGVFPTDCISGDCDRADPDDPEDVQDNVDGMGAVPLKDQEERCAYFGLFVPLPQCKKSRD